jgi:hypothetical protein
MKDKPGITALQKRSVVYTLKRGVEENIKRFHRLYKRGGGSEDALIRVMRELCESFLKDTAYKYDPEFGNDRLCKCGHVYYRHFDSYEEMYPCGCKYCSCTDFEEMAKGACTFGVEKAECPTKRRFFCSEPCVDMSKR